VTNVVLENHRISFDTTAVGVPHMVKVSYFPNWGATGAEGPYRAAPSLMIVVPTEEHVVLTFGYTWAELLGWALTIGSLAAVGGWWGWRRFRRDSDGVLGPPSVRTPEGTRQMADRPEPSDT
jgi:hypothetical protein